MKKLFISILLFSISTIVFSQTEKTFQAGWYIIQKGAKYGIIMPSYADVSQQGDGLKEVETSQLVMGVGEVVIAFDQRGGKTYCFDPLGRMIVFVNGLKVAPINTISGVGHIISDISILDGEDLKSGLFVWIVGQDVAKNTITIMTGGDKKIEIPMDKVELITKTFQNIVKDNFEFREVAN